MLRISAIAALALGLSIAFAQDIVTPNANLKADGIPAISKAIADKVALYADFRGNGFVQWHPKEPTMLVRHREAGANIPQIYVLRKPGGVLEKITDFSEIVDFLEFEAEHPDDAWCCTQLVKEFCRWLGVHFDDGDGAFVIARAAQGHVGDVH